MSGDSFQMPEGMPEGMPDFVKVVLSQGAEQMQRQAMHAQDFNNRWFDLLGKLSIEQLLTVREVLDLEPESAKLNYLDGMVAAVLRLQHQVCPGCGKDHAQDGLDAVLAGENGGEGSADASAHDEGRAAE